MSKKMLVDATHSEETRIAVVDGDRLSEYDYENKLQKPLKGNIYLAKVTRVEPSLQAAFVDYGGNRHGFLPFTEIHPDYFRIPVEDREALNQELREQAEKSRPDHDDSDADDEIPGDSGDEEDDNADDDGNSDTEESGKDAGSDEGETDAADDSAPENDTKRFQGGRYRKYKNSRYKKKYSKPYRSRDKEITDDGDEAHAPRLNIRKKYKIQEVIKRGQIMLVQVSKEERGNKGAAVTSYLSLAGRYCVLMPNSPNAGGVSRKVANYKERQRMRAILSELNVPDTMSVIVRTAGVSRTKMEIKRDFDYLFRLWSKIRELTLQSIAPALINEEGNLIRRSIRDIYTKDIEEILVSGKKGFQEAKDFMKMIAPSYARRIKLYEDDRIPLFHRYKAEDQITKIGDHIVTLKSGGYIVINPTEALVAIDVNSGRATKERHIEETALNTNLEAAEEVARQMRLRDLAGLVVIDFIDMEDYRNNRKVEQKFKDALSKDRARVQCGRISNLGLLELSRQRLNPSLTESQYSQCPHCHGVGYIRTLESTAITILRKLESYGIEGQYGQIMISLPKVVALFILNQKRELLTEIEARYDFKTFINVDESLPESDFEIETVVRAKKDNDGKGDEDADGAPSDNFQKKQSGSDTRRESEDKSKKPASGSSKTRNEEKQDKPSSRKKQSASSRSRPKKSSGKTENADAGSADTDAHKNAEAEIESENTVPMPAESADTVKENEDDGQKTNNTEDSDKGRKTESATGRKGRPSKTVKKTVGPEPAEAEDTESKIQSDGKDAPEKNKTNGANKQKETAGKDKEPEEIPENVTIPEEQRKKGWWQRLIE